MNMKNECSCEKGYVCGICGKSHSTVEDRMACETKCLKEKKAAEEALKAKRLADEKKQRKDVIEAKGNELKELVQNYIKDYGSISLSSSYEDDDFPCLSNFFRRWWF